MNAKAITEALAKVTPHDLRAARPRRGTAADILKLEGPSND